MTAGEDRPDADARFPQFRRLRGGAHFYRIDGFDRFTEVQVVGRRRVVHEVRALVYPELLRIQDMLDGAEGRFEVISEHEWRLAYPKD